MSSDLQSVKEEVRSRIDIVAVVGRYVTLKRTGKNFTGLCPFHSDRKPSFSVVPHLGIYKCFSCGASGDIFKFVQQKENVEFIEALELLAKEAGVPFERRGFNPEIASERERMLELNRLAVRFFQDRLARSQEARDSLAQRALLKATQEQWDVGYAPPEWDALVFHLQQQRADLALAAKIGLVKERKQEGSGYYDAFRHRLIFPIHDLNGNVIAFGGRALSADEAAKYLNSPESLIFDKSRVLFGLFFARKHLQGGSPPVLMEGYIDVITSHQAGFGQCVASLGTSMTDEHARMLARYNPKLIVCYDGDAAGIKATQRSAFVWEQLGLEGGEVRIARLPAGDDPDSLLRRGETTAFQATLDSAIPRVDFEIELMLKRHELASETGRDNALAEAIPILATIGQQSVRARYADRLAYLHPLHGRYGAERAVQQVLADVESWIRQTRSGQSPRSQGYPLTEQSNRDPLQQMPPPPAYRAPSAQNWGKQSGPYSGDIRPAANSVSGGTGPPGPKREAWKKDEWKPGMKRGERRPISDTSPPPLDAPMLTGVEKAEMQLMRALFSPQWRVTLLDRLRPEMLFSEAARQLLRRVARTPAGEDGGIDPMPLLHRVRAEEEEAADSQITQDSVSGGNPAQHAEFPHDAAKLSAFISELWEESVFFVSNDQLDTAAVENCMERLRQHQSDREKRELSERLLRANSTEEQRAIIAEYHEKMRATRGTPSAKPGGPVGDRNPAD